MKYIILLLGIILLYGCEEKQGKIEFVHIKKRIKSYVTVDGQRRYEDVVFIKNPPKNYIHLASLIEGYNRETISTDTVEARYDYFNRNFFRESDETPLDFEDDESFSPDRLFDHKDDFIGEYKMITCYNDERGSKYEWSLSGISGYTLLETIYYGSKCSE